MSTKCICNYDWYQSGTSLVIEVRLRNQDIDDCAVEFSRADDSKCLEENTRILNLRVKEEFVFSTPLHGDIVPEQTTITCTRAKISIKLKKSTADRWSKLDADMSRRAAQNKETDDNQTTTAKKRPNWDQIGKEAEKEEMENMDPTTRMFKMLYDKSDEDCRRAMLKSMFESNGTTCNMNWEEVSKGQLIPGKKERHKDDDRCLKKSDDINDDRSQPQPETSSVSGVTELDN